jgi:hypothetical protein
MTQAELDTIIAAHKLWLEGVGGKRANLQHADLANLNMTRVDLSRANMDWAHMSGADMSWVNLSGAALFEADFSCTAISRANLYAADLINANLSDAFVVGANCAEANMQSVNFVGADLWGVNFFNANLNNTCLDPNNKPNGLADAFDVENGYVVGYRGRTAGHIPEYIIGQTYGSTWFSTCKTECHPGLYICPTIQKAKEFSNDLIKVYTKAEDIHKAWSKYRCRWFKVIEAVS